MCIACPDFVDYCGADGCRGPEFLPDGRPNSYGLLRKFYLDTPAFCEHLTREYGTSIPGLADHVRRGHDGDDCVCIREAWWPRAEITAAVAAVIRRDLAVKEDAPMGTG